MAHREGLCQFQAETIGALNSVYRFALKLTGYASDAKDLFQETFLTAFQRRQLHKLGTNCRAWLFTICRHYWLQQRRRENRVTPYEDAELESLAAGMAGKGEVEGVRKILDHR